MSVTFALRPLYNSKFPTDATLKVDLEKTTTSKQLRELIQDKLSIDSTVFTRYSVTLASHLSDVQSLSDDDTGTLSDLKLPSSATLFVIPPIDQRSGTFGKKARGVGGDTKKAERGSADDDEKRFAGITHENCLAKYKSASPAEQKRIFTYLETYCGELIEGKHLNDIPSALLLQLLKSDALAVDEGALVEFVVAWGKEQKGSDELKVTLKSHLPLLRLPLVSGTVLGKLAPLGLLETAQLLTLLTYVSLKDEKKSLPSDFPFSEKARVPRVTLCQWDAKNMGPDIIITDSKTGAVSFPGFDSIIRATRALKGKDKFYWEITWNGPNSIRIGVIEETVGNLKADLWQVGYALLGSGGSGVYVRGSNISSCSTIRAGDTVGLACDMEKRQITYYLNGVRQQVVFTGLPERVYPAVSNGTGPTTITTKFRLPFPADA